MINLNDLLKSANGQLFGEPTAQLFTEFVFDAAQVRANTMFVAMRTSRGDTHDDVAEAIANGASGILCHEPPTVDTTGITVVIVRDSLDTLMQWSRFVLGRMGARIIGVGGTHGRSIAVRAIAKVLSYKYPVHEGELELEGLLSLPTTVARLKPDTKYVVLKLAPNAPGEMAELVQACQPGIAVINHMDILPTVAFKNEAQIINEHMTLLNSLAPGDLAIVNFDDDVAREMGSQSRAQVRTVAIDTFGADIMALNIIAGADRTGFDIRYENEREVGRWSPILGRHHLIDLLSALLLGIELGVPMRDGLRALSQLSHVSGRMRPLNGKNGSLLIDDTYQANLSDALAALEWLAEVRAEGRRTIFVMGDLDNLGSSSAYAHRTIGARAASLVDHIVTLGTDAALVGRSAIDTEMPARQIRTTYGVQDAINTVSDLMLTPEDVVLVKGGSGMRMEAVVKGLLENPSDAQLLVRQNENAVLSETSLRSLRPSWKEIDGDALARNIRTIRATVGSAVTMMAVVKANGYGHGAVLTARTALANGAEYLGVANMAEALELREAGLTAPILVMTYMPVQAVRQAISENITATVFDLNIAQQYDRAARSSQGKLKVHVKIDTGMGRLGILAGDAINVFRHLNSLRNLEIEGVFTHFASADDNREFTQTQLDIFRQITKFLKAGGFSIRYFHAANSPGTLLGDDFYFNMVRVGLMMYGLNPSKLAGLPSGVQPVMSWKTNILQVKQLPAGHSVGYGRTYMTKGEETIAILPIGYADGLRRSPYTWKEVLVRGKRVPLVGRVSMEKCAINVTGVPDASPGDEVVLLGRQGYDRISAEEVGLWIGSINYEVTTTILPRG